MAARHRSVIMLQPLLNVGRRFEPHGAAGFDTDHRAGLGISSLAGFARSHGKRPEAGELEPFTLFYRL